MGLDFSPMIPSSGNVPCYVPSYLWRFWLSHRPSSVMSAPSSQVSRLHIYDVYDNELTETHEPITNDRKIFQDFDLNHDSNDTLSISSDDETSRILRKAHDAFTQLEVEVEGILQAMLHRLAPSDDTAKSPTLTDTAPHPNSNSAYKLSLQSFATLRRYLVFLRFRNSAGYTRIIRELENGRQHGPQDSNIYPAYKPFVVQMQRRYILGTFIEFLAGNSKPRSHEYEYPGVYDRKQAARAIGIDKFLELMDVYCWRLVNAEICIGIAGDEQEFLLADCCYGTLDEGFDEDPDCCDFFFPVHPTIALYVLGSSLIYPLHSGQSPSTVWHIPLGLESATDVHLRNSMILQTYPPRLFFSSLRTVALSISSYDEFRWIKEHQDYSRLKMRCRQKFLMEGVVKTLVLRESVGVREELGPENSDDDDPGNLDEKGKGKGRMVVRVLDLTDQVKLKGDWAVAFGTFSDVWMAIWEDPIEKREMAVAVKFLRQVMVQNVKDKLIRRLQAEVGTWHKLCHRNVSQFIGIVQSSSSIGMVSPWYTNGTICQYLKTNPLVDRLKLLIQVAAAIAYLHSFTPPIVHGDLKGGNILIDAHGFAIITDFGLSKVMEEVSHAQTGADGSGSMTIGTSFFAGSTRWMAPELIMALVEDEEGESRSCPTITTMSDVYAYGSVCLEVATNQLPYPNRTNDHSVTVDIMLGVPPRRGQVCLVKVKDEDAFWKILEMCWSRGKDLRPAMTEVVGLMGNMAPEGQQRDHFGRRDIRINRRSIRCAG